MTLLLFFSSLQGAVLETLQKCQKAIASNNLLALQELIEETIHNAEIIDQKIMEEKENRSNALSELEIDSANIKIQELVWSNVTMPKLLENTYADNLLFYALEKKDITQEIFEKLFNLYAFYFKSDGGLNKTSFYKNDVVTPLIVAVLNGNLLGVHLLLTYYEVQVNQAVTTPHKNALYTAIKNFSSTQEENGIAIIEILLKAQANPFQQNFNQSKTPYDQAIKKNLLSVVKLLTTNNKLTSTYTCTYGSPLITAMIYAIEKNSEDTYYKDMVHHFIDDKKYINSTNCSQQTPLHLAYYLDDMEIFIKLLNAGAEVNACTSCNAKKNTPLHLVAQNPRQSKYALKMAKELRAYGASLLVKNQQNKYPYEVATDEQLQQLLMPKE